LVVLYDQFMMHGQRNIKLITTNFYVSPVGSISTLSYLCRWTEPSWARNDVWPRRWRSEYAQRRATRV